MQTPCKILRLMNESPSVAIHYAIDAAAIDGGLKNFTYVSTLLKYLSYMSLNSHVLLY